MKFIVEICDDVIREFYSTPLEAAEDIADSIEADCAMEPGRFQVIAMTKAKLTSDSIDDEILAVAEKP